MSKLTSASKSPHRESCALRTSQLGTFRTSRNEEAASSVKDNIDKQLHDINLILDSKYSSEIDIWRNVLRDANERQVFLESDNNRLQEEILYLKSQCSVNEVEQISKLNSLPCNGESLTSSLRLEAEHLRAQLISKIKECNEIRANVNKLERMCIENQNNTEIAISYESRILALKQDYADRLADLEELRCMNIQLEGECVEKYKTQHEADELKVVLEAKREENSRIRREKSEIELEILRNKKAEAYLLDQEVALKTHLATLETEAAVTEDLRKSQYLDKKHRNSAVQDQLRKSFLFEAKVIEDQVNEKLLLAQQKAAQVENLKKSVHELSSDLLRASEEQLEAESSAIIWRNKTLEAEHLKEAEIARANRIKQASIAVTSNECNIHKSHLVNRLDTLATANAYKERDLNQVQREAYLTVAEKRVLEDERFRLKTQINELIKLQDNSERVFQDKMRFRDRLQASSVERIRKEHENEIRRSNNQIQALRNVIEAKQGETDRSRREADIQTLRYVQEENKARQAEAESQVWRDQTHRVARQKDLEYSAEKQLSLLQLRELERAHSIKKLQKINQVDQIVTAISTKEREANDLRASSYNTQAEISHEKYLKSRLLIEAELNRSRQNETKRNTVSFLNSRENLHSSTVDSLRKSANLESNVLRSEVQHLNDTLVRKDIEARGYRDNYSRRSVSPFQRY